MKLLPFAWHERLCFFKYSLSQSNTIKTDYVSVITLCNMIPFTGASFPLGYGLAWLGAGVHPRQCRDSISLNDVSPQNRTNGHEKYKYPDHVCNLLEIDQNGSLSKIYNKATFVCLFSFSVCLTHPPTPDHPNIGRGVEICGELRGSI